MNTSSEETLALADTEEHVPPALVDDSPTIEETRPMPLQQTPSRLWRWCKRLFWLSLVVGILGIIGIVGVFWHMSHDLPDLHSVSMYRPWRTTVVRDIHGQVAMELATQRRRVLAYQKMPKHLIRAIVAAEDGEFFQHKGFDYFGIMRAFWKNLWRRKGAPKQGGSTITQQVVKTFLLSREQTYTRKIKEAILAWRMERHLRKWEILYLYLNQIDFGRGNYGVEEAARYYFGKSATKLTLNESAILAAIPKNPERYNPANSVSLTQRRRDYVLRMMHRLGDIDDARYKRELATPIQRPPRRNRPAFQRDYYTEAVRKEALKRIAHFLRTKRGLRSDARVARVAKHMLYKGGLFIDTALDPRAQRLAIRSLREGLVRIDRKQGFRGPIGHLPKTLWAAFTKRRQRPVGHNYRKALVLGLDNDGYILSMPKHKGRLRWTGMGWIAKRNRTLPTRRMRSLLQPGDLIWVSKRNSRFQGLVEYQLEQVPKVQGALMVLDPRGHQVRALVGGWHFETHPFNRAVMARRQPGSAFKPIVFAAAIESKKLTAASVFQDSPIEIRQDGKIWRPTNASGRFSHRMINLRDGLASSLNTIAVRVLDSISPYRAIAMARRLGIHSRLTIRPSLALGASVVQPLALTNAYATLAARGAHDRAAMLTRILSHNGETIYERLPSLKRKLSPQVAYIVTDMLQDAVKRGTARAARSLKRPIAGKTGTTNRARNAWFIGYTPTVCVGVWVGHDDRQSLGRRASGGRTALPIFVDWMKKYHERPDGTQAPTTPFRMPEGLEQANVDPASGLLAPPQHTHPTRELFLPGTQPTQYAGNHGPVANPKDFYKE